MSNSFPSWIHNVPAILEQLAVCPFELLDRAQLEALVDLRRTATVELMKRCGADKVGHTLIIRRATLIARLREIAETPSYDFAMQRRRRVAQVFKQDPSKAMLRLTEVPVSKADLRPLDDLHGVSLGRGELRVEHKGHQDLLRRLVAVVQAIAADPDRFEELAG